MQIHTAVAKCTQPAFSFVEVGREQTHIIVTFHYRGVALSLIPAVQPGASRTAGLSDKGGERRLAGYREDLIVLWHPQNDIIAVWFHDNNNLQSSCINI